MSGAPSLGIESAIRQPKTRKGARAIAKRQPQDVERVKQTVCVINRRASQLVRNVIDDLITIKQPYAKKVAKITENIVPFEDSSELEFLSRKHDASLFCFASHTKKRPNNLVLGRMFNHHVMDMFEFGVEHFESIRTIKSGKSGFGTKPCILLASERFQTDDTYKVLGNFLVDFFRGWMVDKIHLHSIDRVFVVTVKEDGTVQIRHCLIKLKKAGSATPQVELEEMGPSLDLSMRRNKLASWDLRNAAMARAASQTKKSTGNRKPTTFGEQGKIYRANSDNLEKINLHRYKVLKQEKARQTYGQDEEY
mmetsp:Transcript_18217/g.20262  ORF Transcript_18217/g.20262 Transcript_18217/m.20262 type:complete len:308 (+) Transcript_18217:61-984(+)